MLTAGLIATVLAGIQGPAETLARLERTAADLEEAGQYKKAVETAADALTFAAGSDSAAEARILERLSRLKILRAQYAEAGAILALASDRLKNGPDGDELPLDLVNQRARLEKTSGQYVVADASYRGLLARLEKAPENRAGLFAKALAEAAEVNAQLGKTRDAEEFAEKAENALRAASETSPRDLADTLLNLAEVRRIAGAYSKAVELAEKALLKAEEEYPKDHPALGGFLSARATSYYLTGRLDEAEALWKRALSLQERPHRRSHARLPAPAHP